MGFCGELRANTAVDILIGPFVDDDDGFTAKTGLTIDVELSKNGQALANKNDATAPTDDAAGDIDGYYNCELDTTDTNTEGILAVVCLATDALPVRHDFMVLSEAAWDSKYVAKDDGFMDVNVKTIGRADTQETEANNLESACANYSATRGLTGTALPAAAADAAGGVPISDAGGLDMDAILSRIGTPVNTGGTATLGAILGDMANSPVVTRLGVGAAQATELAKVPKSDSNVSWNATALAAINAEVDTALNTAIPGSPTADSVNERVATMDGRILGTIAAGTHTAQTGDSYARLGAPAGASVSADILAVDNLVDDVETRLGTPSDLGGGATIAANLVVIEGQTDDIGAAGAGLTALPQLPALALTTGTVQTSGGNNTASSFYTDLAGGDNYWNDALILITSGALAGQVKEIGDFADLNGVVTLTSGQAFTATPADGVTFTVINR